LSKKNNEIVTDKLGIADIDVLSDQFGSVFVVEPNVSDNDVPIIFSLEQISYLR
jgi:hypothetical protein